MNKKNILIHSLNWIWFWHIKRLVTIAKFLKNDESIWKIVFVSNSKNPFIISNEWFEFFELKYWIEETIKDISYSDFEDENYLKMSEIIEKEKIDIVLHDTFFIKKLILFRKDLQHFLVLRDSEIDYLETINIYFPYFKKIFIPHIKKEFSKIKLDFFKKHENISFISYILEKKEILIKQKRILISPWYWGDFDNTFLFFKYINDFLIEIFDEIKDFKVEFVLWKYYEDFKKKIDFSSNFKITKFYEDLSTEINSSEIFIWRWWYNTINEVAFYNTKSLIFDVERFWENQGNRIDFFIKKLWFSFINKWIYKKNIDKNNFKELLEKKVEFKRNDDLFEWIKNFKKEFLKEISKENILIFKNIFLPKSENFIFEELNALSDFNPIIFTLSLENEENFKNNFQIIYKKYFEELLNKDYPKILNKKLYLEFLKYTVFLIKRYNIKIIYTEFLFDAYFIKSIKKLALVKIFSAWRGFDIYEFLNKNFVNKTSFIEDVDFLFIRDENMKKEALKFWFSKEKVQIIRSCTDFSKYTFMKKDFSKLDILIWWRFVEKKNLLSLLDLVLLLIKSWIVWNIWIVWDWELKEKILWKIDSLNISNNIKIYWFLPHNDLIKVLNSYNCFINYSKKSNSWDDEWIPNLIIENMLSWSLVFSSYTWWIWEILIDYESWLKLELDLEKDNKKIINFFENWDFDKTLKNALNIAKKTFSKDKWVYKLENIFKTYE
jgi:colanic acid/amylovoran biosynthesis glycosyltransferase